METTVVLIGMLYKMIIFNGFNHKNASRTERQILSLSEENHV